MSTALVEIKHTELNVRKNLGQNQYSSAKGPAALSTSNTNVDIFPAEG